MNGYHVSGIVHVDVQGYGLIQPQAGTTQIRTVYIAPKFVRYYKIQTGDDLTGRMRPRTAGERYWSITQVEMINGVNVPLF